MKACFASETGKSSSNIITAGRNSSFWLWTGGLQPVVLDSNPKSSS